VPLRPDATTATAQLRTARNVDLQPGVYRALGRFGELVRTGGITHDGAGILESYRKQSARAKRSGRTPPPTPNLGFWERRPEIGGDTRGVVPVIRVESERSGLTASVSFQVRFRGPDRPLGVATYDTIDFQGSAVLKADAQGQLTGADKGALEWLASANEQLATNWQASAMRSGPESGRFRPGFWIQIGPPDASGARTLEFTLAVRRDSLRGYLTRFTGIL
jgi:hypothetical protein